MGMVAEKCRDPRRGRTQRRWSAAQAHDWLQLSPVHQSSFSWCLTFTDGEFIPPSHLKWQVKFKDRAHHQIFARRNNRWE